MNNKLYTQIYEVTCRQIAMLTRQPKDVVTARGESPRSLKSLEKFDIRRILARSSATTTHVRMLERVMPRAFS